MSHWHIKGQKYLKAYPCRDAAENARSNMYLSGALKKCNLDCSVERDWFGKASKSKMRNMYKFTIDRSEWLNGNVLKFIEACNVEKLVEKYGEDAGSIIPYSVLYDPDLNKK